MLLYKAKILSFVEFRTAAIYHACSTALGQIDDIQNGFIRSLGITTVESLVVFGLAPLAARRDIAMLGMIHRSILWIWSCALSTILSTGSPFSTSMWKYCLETPCETIKSYRDGSRNLVSFTNLIFGLVDVYNLLHNPSVPDLSELSF